MGRYCASAITKTFFKLYINIYNGSKKEVRLAVKWKITEKDIISTNEVKFLGNNIKFNKINLTKKNYSFGIRPEHFSLSENCQYKFKPNIDLTENLGNEKIAYIKIDGNEISAKIPSQNEIIDQIGFDLKDIFVFDETGTRVRS